jgi:hypothetical protein
MFDTFSKYNGIYVVFSRVMKLQMSLDLMAPRSRAANMLLTAAVTVVSGTPRDEIKMV